MKLSKEAFDRAKEGIFANGRRLEQLLFRHHFDEPILEEVTTELARFQNADGGFGHGMEPDFWLPESSPMATTVGLQVAAELKLEASHPIVSKALDYLRSTYDASIRGWIGTPLSVNAHPHAPWWHRDPDKELDLAWLRLNPGSEIVGYLLRWGGDDFQQWERDVVDSTEDLTPDQLLCCLRLADSPGLSDEVRESLVALIELSAPSAIETDTSKWEGYCIKPLTAIPRPDSLLAEAFADILEVQLDFEIERQSEEYGVWLPHWSWGKNFPESWLEAQKQWAGIITLETLRSFDAFGRLA